ncbi:MAG: hydroxymethylglutaryl-CoA reductase [Parcubacteria group bacterium]|nr:hydroxymethylglutaryl-CoA reductase [Parcubacteria group bacterium]
MSEKSREKLEKILSYGRVSAAKILAGSDEYLGCATKNCENMIGAVSVPLGIAGPLKINGDIVNDERILTLSTTEGCLVASVNRGCKAITLSGGATVRAHHVGITRAPVFRVLHQRQGKDFMDFIMKNKERFGAEIRKTSRFLELVGIFCKQIGRNVFVKFTFDPKDAMGMNMAVIACDHLISHIIEPETKVRCRSLSGNYCSDKKAAFTHMLEGRGYSVNAEVVLTADVLKNVLKTDADEFFDVYQSKIVAGSLAAGSMAMNAHYANIISAIFLATGQDMAHVVEGSLGITSVEKEKDGGVYVNVFLPSVVCGVVGGGTGLPKQSESLAMMGITIDEGNPGSAHHAFVEIIAGAVLAGEISLLACLASQDLARVHKSYRERS